MSKRSLRASAEGAKTVRKILNYRGWTHKYLAEEVGLKTRQPVWRMLSGQPVERHVFIEVCAVLDLDWIEIAEPDLLSEREPSMVDQETDLIETPVEKLHPAIATIQEKVLNICRTLHIRKPNYSVPLLQVFVDLDIVEYEKSQRATIAPQATLSFPKYSLSSVIQSQARIRLLGALDSGKTTLLKALALSTQESSWKIPIFVALDKLYERPRSPEGASFYQLLCDYFGLRSHEENQLDALLRAGDCLILIDDVDHLRGLRRNRALVDLETFSDRYFNNHFVLSCHAPDRTSALPNFVDFEVQALSPDQQFALVKNWLTQLSAGDAASIASETAQCQQALQTLAPEEGHEILGNPGFLTQLCLHWQAGKNWLELLGQYRTCYAHQKLDALIEHTATALRDESAIFWRDHPVSARAKKWEALSQLARYLQEGAEKSVDRASIVSIFDDCFSTAAWQALDIYSRRQMSEDLLKELVINDGLLTEVYPNFYAFSQMDFYDFFLSEFPR